MSTTPIRTAPTTVQEDIMTITATTTTVRPTIDFSGSGYDHETTVDRSTARAYAADLVSRVNKPETNRVLEEIANSGTQVDAYLLAEAVLDAMRGVATRCGQSTMRRRMGEKAAHLGYIAHAVLASHADGLPVYERGDRSRRVEELRGERNAARAKASLLETDLRDALRTIKEQTAHQEESNETIRGLVKENKALAQKVEAWRTASLDKVRALVTQREDLTAERDEIAAVLAYALEQMDEAGRARVFGYWDGVKQA